MQPERHRGKRADPTVEHGLQLFLAIENTRKGAATNAVQIARLLAERLGAR